MTVRREKKRAAVILLVSFGTVERDSREASLGAIQTVLEERFPEYEVRQAFTSGIVIARIKEREGLQIDNLKEAFDRALQDGIRTLAIQPTYLLEGYEYKKLTDEWQAYREKFRQLALAKPLLAEDADYEAVAAAIVQSDRLRLKSSGTGASCGNRKTAVCLMGHGIQTGPNDRYAKLQDGFCKAGYGNYYIGTMEAEPGVRTLLDLVNAAGSYERILLRPLLVTAGSHACRDMAGDHEESWKSVFESVGYEVECILEGLGQIPAVREIYAVHTQDAIDSLKMSGQTSNANF